MISKEKLNMILGALIVRIVVIVYADWHDRRFLVPFTDIDYFVFDDASKLVYNGFSPYERATYRYTPLVAYLLIANQWTGFRWIGKLVFAIFDILCGFLLLSLSSKKYVCCLWLYNPFVIAISSRGSAESIICTLVIAFVFFLRQNRMNMSALFFGLAVHFKLYPIVYTWPLFLYCLSRKGSISRNIRNFVKYGCISGGIFVLLGFVFYFIYGYQFVEETFLYHVTRKDHRHNMSMYFLYFYLELGDKYIKSTSLMMHLFSFLPQIILIFSIGLGLFWKNRPFPSFVFSCFLITMVFVSFNKVCTSQYFLWYICFLPIVIPFLKKDMSFKEKLYICIGCLSWVGSQIIWLWFAYLLEFRGFNTYWEIFLSSCLFFIVNCFIIYCLIDLYKASEDCTDLNVKGQVNKCLKDSLE